MLALIRQPSERCRVLLLLLLLALLNQSEAGIRRVIAVGSCCGEQVARSWDGRHAGWTETMEVGPECDPAAGVSRPDAARAGALARAVAAGGRLVGRAGGRSTGAGPAHDR